jgi:hypothetical protein
LLKCTSVHFAAKHSKEPLTTSHQSKQFVQFFKEAAVDVNLNNKISAGRKRQLDEAFMKMIVLDYQPLTLGERQGMRFFANCAFPGYITPCYVTVKDSLLPAAMKEVEQKVASGLNGNRNFTVATDIWTSRRGHPFIAFIATYVTDQFDGKTVLLGCYHMPGRHTGENIRDIYDLCVSKWKINDKICRIVSDNASNMLKAFNIPGFSFEYELFFENAPVPIARGEVKPATANMTAVTPQMVDMTEQLSVELEMSCENVVDNEDEPDPASQSDLESAIHSAFFSSSLHLSCPIHTLQLAIKDSFDECEDVASLTNKVSKLVNSIRRSTLNTAFTDSLGVRPTVSCVTRWNSQLKMIQSVLKLSERDADFQSKLNVSDSSTLTAIELHSLACLVQALQPLAELTDTWQAECGALGVVLPSVMEVKSLMSVVRGPLAIRIFADTLAKKFEERFQKYYKDVNLVIAAVLDPRFKTEWIMRDQNVRDNILAIREMIVHNAELAAEAAALPATATDLNDVSAASSSTSEQLQSSQTGYAEGEAEASMATTKKPRMIFASYSQKLESSSSASLRTAATELEDYLSLPRLPPSADVLAFWKTNRRQYPQLAQLARATFGIPSGSASAE